MYRQHTVAVVVPAYNEAPFVGDVIETIPSFVDRVYVVDDCSTDGTWEVITSKAGAHTGTQASDRSDAGDTTSSVESSFENPSGPVSPRSPGSTAGDRSTDAVADGGNAAGPTIVPIRNERNRGVGGTIMVGYRRALADGVDVTAVMAGDGQMDPDYLDRLLDPIVEGRAGYAKGNRLSGRTDSEGMSTWRLFGNVLLTFLTKVSSGYWGMLDPQNGYTAISRDALERIDLDEVYEGYGFLNDLLVACNTRGVTVADVSMPAVYGEEESHIEYHTFVPTLSWLLARRFARRLYVRYVVADFHPLALMYLLGAVGASLAVAGLGSALRARSRGASPVGALLASTVIALVSGLSLLLAMTFDRAENEELVVTVE